MDSRLDGVVQLVTLLVLFVIVLAITCFVTKWVAGYQKAQMNRGNLQVIETYRLSQTKYIQIIKVGAVYMVIAVCKDTVTMLGTLEEDQLDLTGQTEVHQTESFQEIFERIKNKKQKQ